VTPYASVVAVKKSSKSAGDSEDYYNEDVEDGQVTSEDEDNVETDAMIKVS
jgi:hypothetical protein